jgi:hypothetical protein
MRYYDQAGVHVLDTQFYKKHVLAGHSLERLQLLPPQLRMNLSVHSCSKKTTVQSTTQPTYRKWTLRSKPPCQQGNQPVTNRSNYIQLSDKTMCCHYTTEGGSQPIYIFSPFYRAKVTAHGKQADPTT